MNRDNIDAISEALGELYDEFQNTIEQYAVYQFTKFTDNPTDWFKKQMAARSEFDRAVKVLVKQFKKKIEKPIEVAFTEVYKDAEEGMDDVKDSKENKEDSLVGASSVPLLLERSINEYKTKVFANLDRMPKQARIGYNKIANDVKNKIITKKITSGDKLYRDIDAALNKGIKDMTVTYKNGRRYTFKAYEEMNVRTTMHQEALNYQREAAREFGVIFWISDFFGDCAKDHAKIQGKVLVDKNWQSIIPPNLHEKIGKFIQSKSIPFMQDVVDGKPYLTTRPNCRHTLKPLTLNQAMNFSSGFLLNKFGMKYGKYEAKKYKNLQRQRYFERQVRRAKQERDEKELELSNAKDEITKRTIQEELAKKKAIVRKWQKKTKDIVRENPYLERDYRREDYKTIVQDVGVKYNRDKK